jgi:hypothetical protein
MTNRRQISFSGCKDSQQAMDHRDGGGGAMSKVCYIPFLVHGPILSICAGISQPGEEHDAQQRAAARHDGYIARDVKSAPVSPPIFITQWDELLQPAGFAQWSAQRVSAKAAGMFSSSSRPAQP